MKLSYNIFRTLNVFSFSFGDLMLWPQIFCLNDTTKTILQKVHLHLG